MIYLFYLIVAIVIGTMLLGIIGGVVTLVIEFLKLIFGGKKK